MRTGKNASHSLCLSVKLKLAWERKGANFSEAAADFFILPNFRETVNLFFMVELDVAAEK